ncbi:hypothetical protein FOXB_03036, partial [Fusarium oxysporum f. sp. conglutinans Fo5176]
NLTPDGYAELQDVDIMMQSDDNTLTQDHALWKWGFFLAKAGQEHGTPFIETNRLKHIMTEIGFVDVKETPFKWPSNHWPKEKRFKDLGEWSNLNTVNLLNGLSMALFTRCLGWTPEEVNVFLVDVRKDLNNPKIHAYWSICLNHYLTGPCVLSSLAASSTAPFPRSRRTSPTTASRRFGHYLRINIHLIN